MKRLRFPMPGLTSLRTRLLAFALLCALPVLTLLALQSRTDAVRLESEASMESTVAAERLQRRVGRMLGSAEGVAHAIGALDLGNASSTASCSEALARTLKASEVHVRNYSVVDLDGTMQCSARPMPAGVNVGDRPYFKRALATGAPALSGYMVGRVTGQPNLQLAVPQTSADGRVNSVPIVAIGVETLTTGIAEESHLPMTLLLFDRDGVLASRYPETAAVPTGKVYAGTELTRLLETGIVTPQVLRGLDGVERLYAYRQVVWRGEVVLHAVAGVELAAMNLAAVQRRLRDASVALVVMLMVAAIAAAATRPVVLGRLGSLAAAARRVAGGDSAARVPMRVKDELAPVEAAFNQMLDGIEREQGRLRESESRWRLLFEHSLDGVLQATPGGLVLAANPQACRMLQRTEAQLQQLCVAELAGTQWPQLAQLMKHRELEGSVRGEASLLRADGSWLELELSSSLYPDENGCTRAFLVLQDVSQRRHAERALERLNAELEQRVQRRTRELETANRDLEAFSYSVSHDLRSPVAVITAFASMLHERKAVEGDQNRHYLRRIQAASSHMNELIEGLLTLARISREPMQWNLVDLGALALEAAQQCRDAEPGREVDLHVGPGLQVVGDRRLLRILVANLLGNAWKFTRHETVARISVTTGHDDEGRPMFCVRDNGVGFEPAYAHRLFEAFQRLHKETEFPGVGIGLATVERVVRRHGGRIWAEAQPGEGAAFFFSVGQEQDGPAVPGGAGLEVVRRASGATSPSPLSNT